MSEHPNAARVREAIDAYHTGDLATFASLFADDVTWHVPGAGPMAGTYRGIEAVIARFARAYGISDMTLRVEPIDVIANDRHAVIWQRVRATRDRRALDIREAIVLRFGDDRVTEAWERTDQHAVDDFFSSGEAARVRHQRSAGNDIGDSAAHAAFAIGERTAAAEVRAAVKGMLAREPTHTAERADRTSAARRAAR